MPRKRKSASTDSKPTSVEDGPALKKSASESMGAGEMTDLNCGFCLQKLAYMTEPKQLPCSHVFCLPCLKEDPKKDCPVCGKVYGTDWTGMKSYLPVAEGCLSDLNTHHMNCDICQEKEEDAVSFCVDCEKKLCEEHDKMHGRSQVFFTSEHQQISISTYAADKERYKPVYCHSHTKEKITKACYNCQQLYCENCKPEKSKCSSDRIQFSHAGVHDLASVKMVASAMKQELSAKLKCIGNKVAAGLNLEKKTWKNLDEVETHVTEMMSDVDVTVEEGVNALRKCGEDLKTKLRDYQRECTEKVENYCSELKTKRDELESLWKTTSNVISQMPDAEMISGFRASAEKVSAESVRYLQAPILPWKLFNKPAQNIVAVVSDVFQHKFSVDESDHTKFKVKIRENVPAHGKNYYTVAWLGKELLIGTNNSLLQHNMSTGKQDRTYIKGSVHCVRSVRNCDVALLLDNVNNDREVRVSFDRPSLGSSTTTLCEVEQKNNTLSHVSVSDQHIAVCDKKAKEVIIFDVDGTRILSVGSGELKSPWGVLLLDDLTVLITNWENNDSLYKYRLEPDSKPVWQCKNLVSPTGICVDRDGYIYVASNAGKRIYLISPQGVLIKELTCDELKKTKAIHDISISEDGTTLALACREEGIKIFNLTTE